MVNFKYQIIDLIDESIDKMIYTKNEKNDVKSTWENENR